MNEAALLSTARTLFGREVGFDEIVDCAVTRWPASPGLVRLRISLQLYSSERVEATALAGAPAQRAEAWLAALGTFRASARPGPAAVPPRPRPSAPDAGR